MDKKIKRIIHFDFHTLPGIKNFGQYFNAEEFAKKLKKANVDAINFFFQDNIGNVFYPTKIGVPYKFMKGNLFKDVINKCHKYGIKVLGYTSSVLNHTQGILHPEWCRTNKNGQTIDFSLGPNFFRTMCFNNEGYRNYYSSILKEVLENYDVDGIFADCMKPFPYCYCDKCLSDMKKLNLDPSNENHVRYFSYKSLFSFGEMVREIVPKDKLLIEVGVPFDDSRNTFNTHGEIECLPSEGISWNYDSYEPDLLYLKNIYDDVVYMTGRFQTAWGDFGGYKGKTSLENDIYDALRLNVYPSIGDHLNPIHFLNDRMFDDISSIYKQVKKYEKYTDSTKLFSEIAILKDYTDISENQMHGAITNSVRGCSRILAELKYQYTVINEKCDFSNYKVIIIPDEIQVSYQLLEKLNAFLISGGKIISSYTALYDDSKNKFNLDQLNFVKVIGKDDSVDGYYYDCLDNFRYATYSKSLLVKSNYSQVQQVNKYFEKKYDGKHFYFYSPPNDESEYSALSMTDNVAYFSFKVFESYYDYASIFHKNLLKRVLDKFVENPILKNINLPSTSRVNISKGDNYTLLHVKSTYPEKRGKNALIVEEHTILPIGYEILVKGNYNNIVSITTGKKLKFKHANGYTIITLPKINGYNLIKLD